MALPSRRRRPLRSRELRAQAQSAGLSPGSGGAGRASGDRSARAHRRSRFSTPPTELRRGRGRHVRGDRGSARAQLRGASAGARSHEPERHRRGRQHGRDGGVAGLQGAPGAGRAGALLSQLAALSRGVFYGGAKSGGAPRQGGEGLRRVRDRAERQPDRGGEPARSRSRVSRARSRGLGDRRLRGGGADEGASPERVRKAQLALAESYIRVGRSADALRASKQALDGATAGDQPRAQYTRARALLMAAASQPAQQVDAIRAKHRRCWRSCRASGGPWGARAAQVVRNGLDNPEELGGAESEGRPAAALGMGRRPSSSSRRASSRRRSRKLEQLLAATDDEAKKNQAEARYLLGLARYRSGDLVGAIAVFDQVLAEKSGAIATTPAICASRRASRAMPRIRAPPTNRCTSRR